MREARATLAIVRHHIDRRFATDWCMQFGLVALLAYVFARTFSQALFPIAIASVLAAVSTGERSHVASLRRLAFFAMPLYGRQLARAHAVAPALAALSIPGGYVAGAFARTQTFAPALAFALFAAATIATLVALSSIFRDGARAALYVVVAALAGSLVALPVALALPHAAALTAAATLLAGYVALRAFGETLARYDPLPA